MTRRANTINPPNAAIRHRPLYIKAYQDVHALGHPQQTQLTLLRGNYSMCYVFIRQQQPCNSISLVTNQYCLTFYMGRDGALVESITINRRVVGSTPALAVT